MEQSLILQFLLLMPLGFLKSEDLSTTGVTKCWPMSSHILV